MRDHSGQTAESGQTCPRIHIVDDNGTLRRALAQAIQERLDDTQQAEPIGHDFAWQLTATDVNRGDIALCDLYPSGYWRKVEGEPLFPPDSPFGGDSVINMVRACYDMAARFLG